MKQLVIMPGGFHPFHAGHAALYQSAVKAFPNADVYVAATNDTSTRPFPFAVKEKLAQLAGVAPNRFVQVKSPFRAEEIVHQYDPNNTQLIFVRSEKDAGSQPKPGGVKKNGEPAYLQPYTEASDQPLSQHAYMAYLPTVEFGPGMKSATEIRTVWPTLNEKRKTALVMSLYPKTQTNPKLAATVVKLLDTAMGTELDEANGPPGQQGAGMTAGYQRRENQPVAETINSAVLNARFKHKQVIGDYTYTATAEDFEGAPLLWIKAYDGNKEIGHILFEIIVRSPGGKRKPSADYLESGGTEVDPAYRNKGVASTMYAYAKMLGNDIQASYNQTSQGKAMWAAWEKAGDAKHLVGTSMESAVGENQGWAATYENTAPNPRVNLTPNFPNYATLIGEFLGIKKNRAVFRIIAAELKPGQGETEKITKALAAGTPVGIEISRVKNRAVVEDAGKEFVLYINGKPAAKYVDQQQAVLDMAAVKKKYPTARLELKHEVCAMQTVKQVNEGGSILEVLKPDAFNALQQAKKNIEQNRQQEIDQWAQDFQANTASKFAPRTRPVAPAPTPVAQPGEKHAVLKNRITQLDLAIKKQQQLDALAQKLEYKGLLTPAMQQDLDTRMYVRDAAADNYQALNQKLDRGIEIATNRLRTNKLAFKEDTDYIEEARKI